MKYLFKTKEVNIVKNRHQIYASNCQVKNRTVKIEKHKFLKNLYNRSSSNCILIKYSKKLIANLRTDNTNELKANFTNLLTINLPIGSTSCYVCI